ncbi:hypothetical protein [Idiomarina sp.]|uniref:hypothetical protein n=1 Tax=Idiomarina sp. TaxID=1874361 RepID=UPI0025C2309E|nr:hypothetical protein [Idiomarina sp.]NQZ03608.1 hypothetical protein [Idiomarina sp.]
MSKVKQQSSLGKVKKTAIDELIVGILINQMSDECFAKHGLKDDYLKHMQKHCKQNFKAYEYFIARIPEIKKEIYDGLKEAKYFEGEK